MLSKDAQRIRFKARLDINAAVEASAKHLEHWRLHEQHPGVPLYSGGLMDAWPAQVVDALAICREEVAAIQFYEHTERLKGGNRNG